MTDDETMAAFDRMLAGAGEAARLAEPGFAPDLERYLSDAFAAELPAPEPSLAEVAAYIDGTLQGAERDAFESALVASPELRAEVEMLSDDMSLWRAEPDEPVPVRESEATIAGLRANFEQGLPLSQDQERALFRDPAIRAEYNRLIMGERLKAPPRSTRPLPAVATLPARIAASTDRRTAKRDFAGGTISIGSGGRPHLVLIRVRFDAKTFVGTGLALRGADGAIGFIALPPPDADGTITRILDLRDPSDKEAAGLIEDPMATGDFVTL